MKGHNMMKLCKDCQHIAIYEGSICRRPIGEKVDPVHGENTVRGHFDCKAERSAKKRFFQRHERCGPDAKFFEQRRPLIPPCRG